MASADYISSKAITPSATPITQTTDVNVTVKSKSDVTKISSTNVTKYSPTDGTSLPTVVRATELRVPRSVQLRLARSLTFGVLGDDSHLYPSSKWATENQTRFQGTRPEEESRRKPEFVITSLDTRKHNPQSKHIFHISRINKKPVCNVQSWDLGPSAPEIPTKPNSEYMTSYRETEQVPRHLVKAYDSSKPIEAIVPLNDIGSSTDVRSEMMLPVCDSTAMPSAHNPHRYLLRKRKVPPPYRIWGTDTTHHYGCGVVYPTLEKPRMTSYTPGQIQSGELPFPNEMAGVATATETAADFERVSISTLSGMEFTRKKFIQPPTGHIVGKYDVPRPESPVCVTKLAGQMFSRRRPLPHPNGEIHLGFDGGVPETRSVRFDDRMLPFMRAKTII